MHPEINLLLGVLIASETVLPSLVSLGVNVCQRLLDIQNLLAECPGERGMTMDTLL